VHTLTIAMASPAPPIVTDHADRTAAAAALATYVNDRDCDPITNQITTAHESYDLICLAQQRVAATATIEPAQTTPTHRHSVTDAELDRLDAGAPVCLAVRPGTLGFQLCWREDHHRGDHKSQDGQTWSDQ
jgi:hypothetical protein